jgi:hypothetical protein
MSQNPRDNQFEPGVLPDKKEGSLSIPLLCLMLYPFLHPDCQHSAGINPWLNLSFPFFGAEGHALALHHPRRANFMQSGGKDIQKVPSLHLTGIFGLACIHGSLLWKLFVWNISRGGKILSFASLLHWMLSLCLLICCWFCHSSYCMLSSLHS